MLDCNTDGDKQLLYSALQNECLLCSVITGVKEDTRVRKVSHLLLLSWISHPGLRERLCYHLTQKSMIQVYSSLLLSICLAETFMCLDLMQVCVLLLVFLGEVACNMP